MGQPLPQVPAETPATTPQVQQTPTAANDNVPPRTAANDNYPQSNTEGVIRTIARLATRAGIVYEGAKLVGRVLFDPNVFGDHNAYFADTPTFDETEAGLVRQGEIDIKQNGMDPTMVRQRVRGEIAKHRKEKEDAKPKAKEKENVEVEGDECKVLAAKIYQRAGVVQGRFTDMMSDKLDLFNKAYDTPSPSLPKGSGTWVGHQHQLAGEQNGLRNDLARYDAKPCYQPHIPQSIRDMAKTPIPQQPGGVPGYPFTALPK